MVNAMVNLRLNDKLLRKLDGAVKQGLYSNRTEFIKSAIIKAIDDFETKQIILELKRKQGEGKRLGIKEPTPEEFERIREEVGNRTLKKHGLL